MIWSYALPNRGRSQAHVRLPDPGLHAELRASIFTSKRSIGERIREGLVATGPAQARRFPALLLRASPSATCSSRCLLALIVFGPGPGLPGPRPSPGQPLGPRSPSRSACGLAFLVQYGLCFLFVQGAFATNTNYGIITTRMALHQAFSGVFAPLAFFPALPQAYRQTGCPSASIVYTPAAIYLGRIAPTDLSPGPGEPGRSGPWA